jgi:2-hydroxychromene-2-carboxylate isomerase
MRGAIAAQTLGQLMPYVEAMYEAMWEQGRNMDEPTEIAQVLKSAGLDAAKFSLAEIACAASRTKFFGSRTGDGNPA